MAHSDLAGKKCEHGMCKHGFCLDHSPQWENVGPVRQEPNPSFFGKKKTYWTKRHCGKAMAQYRVVQTQRCKQCGRQEDHVTNYNLALCLCCGYHFDNISYDM